MLRPRSGFVILMGPEQDAQLARPEGERFHPARPGFPWVTAGTSQEEAKGFSR